MDDFDYALSKGYFRMGEQYFTTSFLQFDKKIYNTVWLRIDLEKHKISKKNQEILKKCKSFTVVFEKFSIDNDLEDLFERYREAVNFYLGTTLKDHLSYGSHTDLVRSVKIYDQKKLIGCGIYEQGANSAEGLINIYDVNYKKYSIGKFIMLTKIHNAIEQGLTYFYPGYYAPGYPSFDYKIELSPSATEYFHPYDDLWHPLVKYGDCYDEINIMYNALREEENRQHLLGSKVQLFEYPFFDFHLFNFIPQLDPLTYPIFLASPSVYLKKPAIREIIVFNTRKLKFEKLWVDVFGEIQYYRGLTYKSKNLLFNIMP
jgi:arginine-tRNA-protein transferase